jgi:hypothetical protein
MASVSLEQLERRAAEAEKRLDCLEERQLQGVQTFICCSSAHDVLLAHQLVTAVKGLKD